MRQQQRVTLCFATNPPSTCDPCHFPPPVRYTHDSYPIPNPEPPPQVPYTKEDYEAAKARNPELFGGDVDSLQYGQVPQLPAENVDKMVAELTERCGQFATGREGKRGGAGRGASGQGEERRAVPERDVTLRGLGLSGLGCTMAQRVSWFQLLE